MLNSRIRFTYRDYKSLPESETERYELLDGDLVMVPAPSLRHQTTAAELFAILHGHAKKEAGGRILHAPFDVVLGEDVVQPDIVWVSPQRFDILHDEELRGAPGLAVEILSPSTAGRDRTYKQELYARCGVREYWIVDPDEETVEVLALTGRAYELVGTYSGAQSIRSSLLPRLEFPIADLFRDPSAAPPD